MTGRLAVLLAAAIAAAGLSSVLLLPTATVRAEKLPAATLPEFTRTDRAGWIGSPPLTVAELGGSVLLVDVWTFGCWNCYRSFPWLNALERRLAGRPFRVIGIHSPEFDHERDARAVAAKAGEFGLHHPVMLDDDHAYWRALGNRYWPAFYLVDKRGRVRARFVGETHERTPQAAAIEAEIDALLAEPL